MLGYLGAVFLGPFAPLAVFMARGDRAPFVRAHAAQALNVTLTCLLYALSGLIVGGLLAIVGPSAALTVMLPIATIGWLIMLRNLIRGAIAANRGDYLEMPRWICSPMVH